MMRIVVLQIAVVVRDCEILLSETKDFCKCSSSAFQMLQILISPEEETVPTDLNGTGVLLMKWAIMNTQKNEQLWFVQRETSKPIMQV